MKRYFHPCACEKTLYTSLANRPLRANKFSRFRGVQKSNNPKKPYRVHFNYGRQRYYIGLFVDEIEAARAYNAAVLEVIGEHAVLNDIPD